MKVVFLSGAEEDIKIIRRYVLKNFGAKTWLETKARLKASVATIETFPLGGSVPDELTDLGLDQYRQLISGMNRVIYEVTSDLVYVHIVCDARREMTTLLSRRLLRTAN
ncbi:type II toxin-antitoxin system RelE/ParE family toxin [Roseateles sp.]|uniref:type II toxin-antitoxin system RelE/ParE family toxin n=1 Tax=Roseateles sp. TaxID=1971397 RepID=UPI0032662D53